MASTFSWGGQSWGAGDLDAFKQYLSQHGTDYATWASTHADAAAILAGGTPVTSQPGQTDASSSGADYGTTPASSTSGAMPAGTDTSTSGATGDASATGTAPVDWSALLGEAGLPQDVIDELTNIFQQTGGDLTTAIPLAQAYVRGTSWYAQTYPGIQDGINAGLFSDESGYMQYENQVNQIYQQYYGRNALSSEVSGYITGGKSVSQIANQFQSAATQANFSDPLQGLFSPDELTALANEESGIDTALGQHIQAEANLYSQVGTLYQNFYGRAPTRADLDNLTSAGTDAATVAQQFATSENINAMDPSISSLFTPAEIQQIALDAAGGTTQNGAALTKEMTLASQLNTVYQQYYGTGITRQQLDQAYQSGTTAATLTQQLATQENAAGISPSIKSLFTPAEIQEVAGDAAGGLSQNGVALKAEMDLASQLNPIYQQYQNGTGITRQQLDAAYQSGTSADTVGKQFAGSAYISANQGDIQQTSGAFGDTGQLTAPQLTALGNEQAGLDTPLGQQLATAFSKAQQRMQGAFKGVLASPALSLSSGSIASQNATKPSDVQAP